jgi:hypothetical protein
MSETWYRAWPTFNEIDPVEVEKYTDKMVWINGDRRARITDHQSYFPTWDEAHACLLRRATCDLESARSALMRAQGRHGNVVGMRSDKRERATPNTGSAT